MIDSCDVRGGHAARSCSAEASLAPISGKKSAGVMATPIAGPATSKRRICS